jgi:sugar lactone lactonase YvrE
VVSDIDVVSEHCDELGEGPHWDAESQTLLRVDTLRGEVRRLDPTTGRDQVLKLESPIGFAIPSRTGQLVVGIGHDVNLVGDDEQRTTIATVEAKVDDLRLNDAKCDRQGRLHFGSLSKSFEATGGLYRLSLGGTAEQILSGVAVSNGMAWDDARERYYYTDSWRFCIDVFDCDPRTGDVSGRRTFAEVDSMIGMPDGMALDVEGGLWVALFAGGRIHRYDPQGRLSDVLELPVTHPTSVAFGGQGMSTLFITSSRHRLDADQRASQHVAGSVFACTPGVAGAPVPGFG